MKFFGFTVTRQKASGMDLVTHLPNMGGGGWFPLIRESFTGAWQRSVTVNSQSVLAYSTVWACITLIAGDIAKLWIKLVEKDANGICTETESPAFSPVLREPNHFSTRVKFFEHWMLSKLTHGNTYVLLERDNRDVVVAMYVLDPRRVQVLVSPRGDVFYTVSTDTLAGITDASVTIPARNIIHDICVPMFHPLVGVSPIFACGLAATAGLKIQNNSTLMFANGTQISGVLASPNEITPEVADRLQKNWDMNYTGEGSVGRVAIVGNGFKFHPMTMSAVDAQLVDQLKMSDQMICATFHVPGYMVGIGPAPPYTDIQSINLQYYTQALQNPIENLEVLLVKGLGAAKAGYGIEFDLKALARMDTKTQVENATKGILGGLWKPNEARADFDLKPVEGGDTVYLQHQQYSLAALNRRDQMDPPPPTPALTPAHPPANTQAEFSTALVLKMAETDWTDLADVA